MEHREAERQNVALRYIGGELTTVEREEFEWHYFECAECAHRVRAMVEARFFAEAWPSEPAPGRAIHERVQPGWFDAVRAWRPSAALAMACVALVFTSYEALRARSRLAPQPVAAYHLLPDDARGAERSIDSRSGDFVVLTADLREAAVPEWKWQIRNAEGGGLVLEGVAAAPPGGRLNLLVPKSRLTRGKYILSLRDTNLVLPEATYSFRML